MTEFKYLTYAEETDMTFLMVDRYADEKMQDLKETECLGFCYGYIETIEEFGNYGLKALYN